MLPILDRVLNQLCTECNAKRYDFILEADVSGWLFHLFLSDPEVTPNEVHLDTRVAGASGRYDLVVGPTDGTTSRPSISPRLVVEVKVFPRIGFTAQQNRVHYKHVLDDDLRKLGSLDSAIECRAEVLVDGCDYLSGQYAKHNRLQHLSNLRNQVAAGANIFLIKLSNGVWQLQQV
jgi:hypothetical protein